MMHAVLTVALIMFAGPRADTPKVFNTKDYEIRVKDLVVADAWGKEDGHLGSYIRFTPDGLLYMSTGEREEPDRSQNLADDAGKVLRLRDDGTIPKG